MKANYPEEQGAEGKDEAGQIAEARGKARKTGRNRPAIDSIGKSSRSNLPCGVWRSSTSIWIIAKVEMRASFSAPGLLLGASASFKTAHGLLAAGCLLSFGALLLIWRNRQSLLPRLAFGPALRVGRSFLRAGEPDRRGYSLALALPFPLPFPLALPLAYGRQDTAGPSLDPAVLRACCTDTQFPPIVVSVSVSVIVCVWAACRGVWPIGSA